MNPEIRQRRDGPPGQGWAVFPVFYVFFVPFCGRSSGFGDCLQGLQG